MAIEYNVEEDFLFKEGLEKGKKEKKEMIINLLRGGKMSLEEVAKIANMPLGEIRRIAKEIKK